MTLSKVKFCQPSGTFDGKYGTLYKFEYTFEDDVTLTANHKSDSGSFAPGTEVEYEIKGKNEYGQWGSVKKPNADFKPSFRSGGDDTARQLMIVKQSSLKCAVDILIHNHPGKSINVSDVEILAERLTGWVMDKPKQEPQPEPNPQVIQQAAQSIVDNMQTNSDELTF